MTRYYHGTTLAKLGLILAGGLDPECMSPDLLDEDEEPMPFVFLAELYDTAAEHGQVVIEVDLPDVLESQVRHDLGEFARCPVVIPPACLISW